MSIKIEHGKWYVLNDGQIVGPAEPTEDFRWIAEKVYSAARGQVFNPLNSPHQALGVAFTQPELARLHQQIAFQRPW